MDAEAKEKSAYAALLYRQPGVKPFEAALSLFSHDTAKALQVSNEWPRDEFVLSEIARFAGQAEAEENKLPTKDDLLREIWTWISKTGGLMSFDEKIKAAKLYAELQDFIPKPGTAPILNSRHVMIVKDHGSDDDWAAKLQRQQNQLLEQGEREIAGERVS